jgi:hypothetical protein
VPAKRPATTAARSKDTVNQLALTQAAKLNDAARARAAKLGTTPKGAITFSRILGLADQRLAQLRYEPSPAHPVPPPEAWVVSGKFPVWPEMHVTAYKKVWDQVEAARAAKDHARVRALLAKPFTPPKLRLVPDLAPMGKSDITGLTGQAAATVHQWWHRGRLPEYTWPDEKLWATMVIAGWWAVITDTQSENARVSRDVQLRASRTLVTALKTAGLIDFDVEAGTVRVSGAEVSMPARDVLALDSM